MRLYYSSTDCPPLTDEQQRVAHAAATEALGDADPVIEFAKYMTAADAGENVADMPWSRAEAAAIDAVTRGWSRVPESLVLSAD